MKARRSRGARSPLPADNSDDRATGGKSRSACLPRNLPSDPGEALEVSMIASVGGTLSGGRLIRTRPYRAPHHSASMVSLVGGGLRVRPGEVSLAHLGVLFLDELPEFQRQALDSLRQPLETGKVSVARANAHVTFPARVQLVAAMTVPMRPSRDPALASRARPLRRRYQAKFGARVTVASMSTSEKSAAADLVLPPPAKARPRGRRGSGDQLGALGAMRARRRGPMRGRRRDARRVRPHEPGRRLMAQAASRCAIGARLPPGLRVARRSRAWGAWGGRIT